MENVQQQRLMLKKIMTEKPMTQLQYDALQRQRVKHRRHLEDIAIDRKMRAR